MPGAIHMIVELGSIAITIIIITINEIYKASQHKMLKKILSSTENSFSNLIKMRRQG